MKKIIFFLILLSFNQSFAKSLKLSSAYSHKVYLCTVEVSNSDNSLDETMPLTSLYRIIESSNKRAEIVILNRISKLDNNGYFNFNEDTTRTVESIICNEE